ncbi:MAG: UvrD-helicase domain-containing protein [Bacteroidota bacterium]
MSKNLFIYKASAGSGKTFSLVKEYLRLALGHKDPDYFRKILAITFTNKAAREMKERVIDTLRDFSKEKKNAMAPILCEELNFNSLELTKQAEEVYRCMVYGYNDIAICTIDSFVIRLLRSFTKELNIPSGFEVDLETDEMLDLAIEQLIQTSPEKKFIKKVLLTFIEFRLKENKYWDFRDELKGQSKVIFNESSQPHLHSLSQLSQEEFITVWDQLKKLSNQSQKAIELQSQELIQEMNQAQIDVLAFKGAKNNPFAKISRYLLSNESVKLFLSESNINFLRSGEWFKKGDEELEGKCAPFLTKWSDKIELLLEAYTNNNSLLFIQESIYPIALFNEINKIIDDLKQEEGSILISDNHQLINDVVQNNPIPFVYERLGERYNHLMIDEFQDTSLVQFQNAIPIIEENLSKDQFNLIVGDTKQSIYRFRGGEFEQLAKLPQHIHEKEKLSDGDAREGLFQSQGFEILLEHNYRSKNEIVYFNNDFFKKLIGQLDDSIDLKGAYSSYSQIPINTKKGGLVHLQKFNSKEYISKISVQLLQNIEDCLEDGFLLSDICILVRGKRQGEKIAKILSEESDYPFISSDSLKMGSSRDIQLIVNYIRHLLDQNNIVSAMNILQLLEPEDANIAQIIDRYAFKKEGEYYREHFDLVGYLKSKNIHLEEIQDDLSLLEIVYSLIGGFAIQLNNPFIQQFLDFSQNFGRRNGMDLVQFVNYWDETYQNKGLEVPEGKNAIKILTIHKSKGLEFPVVFLPFSDFPSGRSSLFWTEQNFTGIDLKHFLLKSSERLEQTCFKSEFQYERNLEFIDNLNLFYVALTRPEERLYIFFKSIAKKEKIISKNKSPHAWLNSLYAIEEDEPLILGERELINRIEQRDRIEPLFFKKNDWKRKLVFDQKKMDNYYQYEKIYDKKLEGILIHEIFEHGESLSECLDEISKMRIQMRIDEEQSRELKLKFKSLFTNESIRDLFELNGKRLNEASLVNIKAEIFRPDKIIIQDQQLHIIDFKTGEYNEDHESQLENYSQLLLDMGYSPIHKHLLYFNDEKLISWN